MKKYFIAILLFAYAMASCAPTTAVQATIPPTSTPALAATVEPTPLPPPTPVITPTHIPLVPVFQYIVIVIFENKEFGSVIGNAKMPYFNALANANALLTSHYAVIHPSLPNYLAMMGGETFDITENCEDCFINAPSLPDFIEQSGRTWKTYQESMPEPCFIGSSLLYAQKHNPFIYFDPIRLDAERCARSIVPLTQLNDDMAMNSLPNFIFITPNVCHSAHDCKLELADEWLKSLLDALVPALDSTDQSYLVILTWDEGQGDHSCCGLPEKAGGRIPTVLISHQVKRGFKDETPYSHYSILKTIAESWSLPYLGHAADAETNLIIAPWR